MKFVFLLTVTVLILDSALCGWFGNSNGNANHQRVRLSDVSAITLHQGQMTAGRRSSPVPQLSCVGGTAGCHAFQPRVVQCLNRGSDGSDAQWECKTDMDVEYRFGRIQVSCEGYDYPEDPFILKGSCGLEYEIDFTEEGRRSHGHHGGGGGGYHSNHYSDYSRHSGGGIGKVIQLIIMASIAYWLFKCCCTGGRRMQPAYSADASSATGAGMGTGTGTGAAGQGGGFWTGAATGGLLGYMFGNRGGGYGGGYGNGYGGGYGGGGSWWGRPSYRGSMHRTSGWSTGGGWGSGGGWSSSSRSSGGSRSTSGFGGTSRR